MKKPYISIIIPVYNTGAYIGDCLDSIMNQTFSDWECICVDDGSKDNSLQILQEYAAKDTRFKVFHQENQGQSVARNLGLEKLSGEYFTFVDSDDMIAPCTLTEWASAIRKTGCDCMYEMGGVTSFHLKNELNDFLQRTQTKDVNIKVFQSTRVALGYFFLERGSCGTTWGKVYRSVKLADLRFEPGISYAEDSTYYLQIFRRELKWCAVNTSNYAYRRDREGSHSSTISASEKVYYFKNSYDHLKLLEEYHFSRKDRGAFWEKGLGGAMRYILNGSEECWCLLNEGEQQIFRETARNIRKNIGYYPLSFFMWLRIEIFYGHCEMLIRFCEYLYYGVKKKLFKRKNHEC